MLQAPVPPRVSMPLTVMLPLVALTTVPVWPWPSVSLRARFTQIFAPTQRAGLSVKSTSWNVTCRWRS
jgi:hypothetical protein